MKRSSNSNAGCKCFPLCTTITYEAETSESEDGYTFYEYMLRKQNNSLQNRWAFKYIIKFLLIIWLYFQSFTSTAALFVSFEENQYIASKRSELYGTSDFLAAVGGLFGLFFGASMLSMVELFYYISLYIKGEASHLRKNSRNEPENERDLESGL